MKSIKILIALCPAFVFSQETSNSESTSKPQVTYCNENGKETLDYIPLCDSLDINMKNYKITSFETELIMDGKLINVENKGNKISGSSKNLIKNNRQGIVFFVNIKAINIETNEEVKLSDIRLKWDTN